MAEFEVDGGTGYLAVPEGGHGPGVLVLHAWWGLTPFFEGVCDLLAAEGFVALAPDRYGGPTAKTIEEAGALQRQEDPGSSEAKLTTAVDYLLDHEAVKGDGLATLGFSAGAAWALLLSTLKPQQVKAVVAFYGSGHTDYSGARAAYLGHYAEVDEWEPVEYVRATEEAIRAAGCEVTFYTYPDVDHWFFEQDRPDSYDAEAAHVAWERTLEFLRARLGGG
ncbi:MAG TPA: dienelactone hydrolase family protein [Rubrobacter sp.]|nr:dienelactone hydrolase family protein [Rubrobacter sp.]